VAGSSPSGGSRVDKRQLVRYGSLVAPGLVGRERCGLPCWKLTPVASPDDPRWQGRRIWREVFVEAPTAAFARLYAAEWELQDMDGQVGNESPSPKSGFEDEKLYWVRRVSGEEAQELRTGSQDGARILRASKLAEQADEVPTERRPLHL
jgi:hypothetical protein